MRPDLQELVDEQAARVTPASAWPASRPGPAQARADWLDEVAQLRHEHDAMALESTRRVPPFPAATDQLGPDQDPEWENLTVWFDRVPVADSWRSAKVYRPTDEGTERPAVLVLHGGGWWMGGGATGFEIGDPLCRRLSLGLGAVVVALDYRLAPEHPFPAGLDDAEATVQWMHSAAARLGLDRSRIAVFGNSAGGNLAAAVARRLRRTDHALALQVLHVPALDLRFDTGRKSALAWEEEGRRLRDYYLAPGTDVDDPEVSPALAEEHLDLPPAVVVVGTHDPLREEGILYHRLLTDAGVTSRCLEHEMTHGLATPDVARAWLDETIEASRGILAPGRHGCATSPGGARRMTAPFCPPSPRR